jgi:hypothetical protein
MMDFVRYLGESETHFWAFIVVLIVASAGLREVLYAVAAMIHGRTAESCDE